MMKKLSIAALLLAGATFSGLTGCARPGEFGYTSAYTAKERYNLIARNWDNEGKMMMDDIDSALLLRPGTRMTYWNLR